LSLAAHSAFSRSLRATTESGIVGYCAVAVDEIATKETAAIIFFIFIDFQLTVFTYTHANLMLFTELRKTINKKVIRCFIIITSSQQKKLISYISAAK
jgi:hypothetical protein